MAALSTTRWPPSACTAAARRTPCCTRTARQKGLSPVSRSAATPSSSPARSARSMRSGARRVCPITQTAAKRAAIHGAAVLPSSRGSRAVALKVARRGAVPPFIAMEVLRDANERAARGENILHLEVGQPSTAAPRAVIEAAKRVLDSDQLGYTEAL